MGEPQRRKESARSAQLSFLHTLKLFLNHLEQDKSHCYVPWKTNSQSTCFVLWIISHLLQKSDRETRDRSPMSSPLENLGQLIFLMFRFLPDHSRHLEVRVSHVNSIHQLSQLHRSTCIFPVHWMMQDGANSKSNIQAWILYLGHHCSCPQLMSDLKAQVTEQESCHVALLKHLALCPIRAELLGPIWQWLVFSEPCGDNDGRAL